MQFGFVVDKNAPWRIYADLDSPAMQVYMDSYGIDDVNHVFRSAYYKTYLTDMEVLKTYFLDFLQFICYNESNGTKINAKDIWKEAHHYK